MQLNSFPKLSDIIQTDKLPDALSFLHNGVLTFLDDIFFDHYVHEAMPGGFTALITLLAAKQISINIPGVDGLKIILNPGYATGTMTALPLSITFYWPVKEYLNDFNNATIVSNRFYYDLAIKVARYTDEEKVDVIGKEVIGGSNDLNVFAAAANNYGSNITGLDPNRQVAISQIVAAVKANSTKPLNDIIYDDYINDPDASVMLGRLTTFVYDGLGEQPLEILKTLLIPQISANINLSIGIEVPRTVLIPMKLSGSGPAVEVDPDPAKLRLLLSAGDLHYSSFDNQWGFSSALSLNFAPPHVRAQIADTPLAISFTNAKLQFFDEPDGSKRSVIGIASAEIFLPPIFNSSNNNPSIVAADVSIDSKRGFSGTIGINGNGSLTYTLQNGISLTLNSFNLKFLNGTVLNSTILGTIIIPGFQVNPLNVRLVIGKGFELQVLTPPGNGIDIIDNSSILITLDALTLGEEKAIWEIGFAARLLIRSEIPVIGKAFPKYINIYNFLYDSGRFNPKFDIEAKWANGTSLRGNQSSGLTAYFPINLNSGFTLKGVQINAKADPDFEIEALLQGVGLNIAGGVIVKVDDLGVKFKLDNTNGTSGNNNLQIGPFNAEMRIVGPKGLTVEINIPPVKGTGYLYFNDDEYIGALGLTINSVKVNAIGIINTKMPDGSKGLSMLVIISAEFPSVPLVMGFTLQGIGGLLGLNRTMKTDAIRIGIGDRSIEHILFPQIKENTIHEIVTDLKQIFPMQKDQFVVGPMFKLGWPSPKLIDIEMGILIEFSHPFRLAIVGRINIQLPKDQDKTIVINVAFLGVIDFDKKYLTFDASIYDSKILTMSLSGDIAVRVFWGDHKEMVVSIGGFHPAFKPAANLLLPAVMKRIQLGLKDDKNFKLTLSMYLAVTSNTVQFGAKLDMIYTFSKFKVSGYLGLDVLFQFNPFKFIADIYAGLAVSIGDRELLSVSLELVLDGPKPWHAVGSAEFEILGIKKSVSFNKTWGEQATAASVPQVSILPQLNDALQNKDNWAALLPAGKELLVSLKTWPAIQLVLHPLGVLTISQKIIPLGVKIERIGTAIPTDGGTYNITQVKIENQIEALSDIQENFAPAQFKNLNDDEKLKAASFEYLNAGVSVKSAVDLFAESFLLKEMEYEVIIIDNQTRVPLGKQTIDSRLHNSFFSGGLIGANELSDTAQSIRSNPTAKTATDQERYRLVSKDTLSTTPMALASLPAFNSQAEAKDFKDSMGLLSNAVVAVPTYY